MRENYAISDDKLLMVITDRLSAFDVILGQLIPDKGYALAQMSDFWFNKLRHIVLAHETGIAPETVVAPDKVNQVRGRTIMAKRPKSTLVKAMVRGYPAGSGWKDYQATGAIYDVHLASGLQNA